MLAAAIKRKLLLFHYDDKDFVELKEVLFKLVFLWLFAIVVMPTTVFTVEYISYRLYTL